MDFSKKSFNHSELTSFSHILKDLQERIGFKVSARGWCYQLEQEGYITKASFDRAESLINRCRKTGLLPIDFVAEEDARAFKGIEIPDTDSPGEFVKTWLNVLSNCEDYYTPDWWEGEEYYIQMLVEKIDLVTLFSPVCRQFHIPIANSKGWSSMLQRAEYARRFREAELKGLKCVLMYFGDHDPDGLRISEFIRKNLEDVQNVVWSDFTVGYDPSNLIIHRFGLNYDFISEHNLSWIDNLITGSGKNLEDSSHKNHFQPYVQEYLNSFGARKCEANALVPIPAIARGYVRREIETYLGRTALARFKKKQAAASLKIVDFKEKTGLTDAIKEAFSSIRSDDYDD